MTKTGGMRFQESDNSLRKLKPKRKKLILLLRIKETLSFELSKVLMNHLTIRKSNILQRLSIHSIDLTLKPKKEIFPKCISKKTTLERTAAMRDLLLAQPLLTLLQQRLILRLHLEVMAKNQKAQKRKLKRKKEN